MSDSDRDSNDFREISSKTIKAPLSVTVFSAAQLLWKHTSYPCEGNEVSFTPTVARAPCCQGLVLDDDITIFVVERSCWRGSSSRNAPSIIH